MPTSTHPALLVDHARLRMTLDARRAREEALARAALHETAHATKADNDPAQRGPTPRRDSGGPLAFERLARLHHLLFRRPAGSTR